MIEIEEARKMIADNVIPFGIEEISIDMALDRILALDMIAVFPSPLFNNSAVDGYAIRINDFADKHIMKYKVVEEIQAGKDATVQLNEGQAVRIFTGALVPDSVDTVIMQEDIVRENSSITIQNGTHEKGDHIRIKGEQIEKGDVALTKGTRLNPAGLGYLKTVGIEKINVTTLPSISIITTGDEFSANVNIQPGQIPESNHVMLRAALQNMGLESTHMHSSDDLEELTNIIKQNTLAPTPTLTLITGGVSVGDYDFTRKALEDLGFEIVFHNINQKPGKPMLFARNQNNFAFGLPGNPRSVLVCFYEYVYPFINAQIGSEQIEMTHIMLPITHDYTPNNKKPLFLTAKYSAKGIKILGSQNSHMLQSFAEADALVLIPTGLGEIKKDTLLNVHLLP